MDYNAPSFSTDPNADYVGKTASTQGSKVPPKAVGFTQREIVRAIRAAGLTASNNDLTQLVQAISRGIWLGTFAGTANALTATMPGSDTGADRVLIPQFQPGMRVRGIAAYANTSATPKVTLTGIGSAGATVQLPIVGPDGTSAIPVPAWAPGQFLTFDIDASGNARFGGIGDITSIINTTYAKGSLIARRVFATPGTITYTPTAGTNRVRVTVVGGGGAGGGVSATGAGQYGAAGGGGAGGITITDLSSGFSGASITVGVGGTPLAGGGSSGGAGGSSSFGTFCAATGGQGGSATGVASGSVVQAGGPGGVGSGGSVVNGNGASGYPAIGTNNGNYVSGAGGQSAFGAGGNPGSSGTGNGQAATSPGAGGAGAMNASNQGAYAGGPGAPGLAIVEESA